MVLRTCVSVALIVLVCAQSGWAELAIQTQRKNIVQGEPMRWQVTTDQKADTLVVTLTRDKWSQTLYRGEIVKGFIDSDVGWLHEGLNSLHNKLVLSQTCGMMR